MCTIVLMQRVHADYPVVIAANRDEFYARRTSPPMVLADEPRVVGGRDDEAGGTWMGVTANGLFVGLTNQRTYGTPDRTLRSRGEVVLEALRTGDVRAVTRLLEALDPRDYNPFNLVYGDAEGLHVAYAHRGSARVELEPVPDGVHVLPNDRLDSAEFVKVARARALARTDRPLAELACVLADHDKPSLAEVDVPPAGSPFTRELVRELHALCIHTPAYGTKSSTILALEPGAVARYLYADGAPCAAELADVTDLLSASSSSARR